MALKLMYITNRPEVAEIAELVGKLTSTIPEPQCMLTVKQEQAKLHNHRCQDSSQAHHQRPKSEQCPNSWKSPSLPQNSWNNPPSH